MVQKRIARTDGDPVSLAYTWDGWNIVRETRVSGLATTVTRNVWGLDLSGTLQGAGGVDGLLAVVKDDGVYLPTYDVNGNVSEYVATNGAVAAHYDYSPFGEIVVSTGPLADTFTHRFSTKPWCTVTGFSEYQMRKYRPDIGRWMSRDVLEDTDRNILAYINNHAVNGIDLPGREEIAVILKGINTIEDKKEELMEKLNACIEYSTGDSPVAAEPAWVLPGRASDAFPRAGNA